MLRWRKAQELKCPLLNFDIIPKAIFQKRIGSISVKILPILKGQIVEDILDS
jgi:hypothetical protein